MRIFKCYFYLNIAVIATTLALSAMLIFQEANVPFGSSQPLYIEWTIILLNVLMGIQAFAPVSLTYFFKERKWVISLFIYSAGSTVLSVLASIFLSESSPMRPSHLPAFAEELGLIVGPMTLLGFAASLVGCYAVRHDWIRNGFRWLARANYITMIILLIWVMFRISHWPVFGSDAVSHLALLPIDIVYLLLLYSVWDADPNRESMEEAVSSLGSPEENE